MTGCGETRLTALIESSVFSLEIVRRALPRPSRMVLVLYFLVLVVLYYFTGTNLAQLLDDFDADRLLCTHETKTGSPDSRVQTDDPRHIHSFYYDFLFKVALPESFWSPDAFAILHPLINKMSSPVRRGYGETFASPTASSPSSHSPFPTQEAGQALPSSQRASLRRGSTASSIASIGGILDTAQSRQRPIAESGQNGTETTKIHWIKAG